MSRNAVVVGILGLVCFSSFGAQSPLNPIDSYLPPAGYVVNVTSRDGAVYQFMVAEDVLISVEAYAIVVPLPSPQRGLIPSVFRGNVVLRFLRVEPGIPSTQWSQVMVDAPVGIAIKEGSVEIRKRN